MSYILTPQSLTHRISNLLLNAPGTFTFKPPNWATHINVTCVGGGGTCGNSFSAAITASRVRGGGGGGGGALAYADTMPLNGNTIITARVANTNSLKAFSEEQTSFVALNSTVIVEASSGLAGGDLNTSGSGSFSATGGAGGIVLVGNGGNGKSGGGASSPATEAVLTSPVISWRKFQGGSGGGAGGYSNDADNGGGGNGGSRTYNYVIGTFAAGYTFHSITARFSGGGVGLFGKGSNGDNGGVQTLWDGNNTSQQQVDVYSVVNGGAGSNGNDRRYGGGMGGGARYFTSSGGVSTWSEGPQTSGIGGNSQIFAGTGAVRIQFLSS
jgi:hypothetical protein